MNVYKIHMLPAFDFGEGVSAVIDDLRRLAEAGQWSEIRALTSELLAGEPDAIVYKALAHAYVYTAIGGEDWRMASVYARMCYDRTAPGGVDQLKALALLSLIAADTSKLHQAYVYAKAFLHDQRSIGLPQYPWIIRVIGFIHYQRREYARSIPPRLHALRLFQAAGDNHEAVRTAIGLAWAYAHNREFSKALEILPRTVTSEYIPLIDGVLAYIYASTGRPQEAIIYGRRALCGVRKTFDMADAAEVALVLSVAYRQLHLPVAGLLQDAALYASRQAREVSTLLVLNQRAKGGETPYEKARGSANPLDGACYTTGVA